MKVTMRTLKTFAAAVLAAAFLTTSTVAQQKMNYSSFGADEKQVQKFEDQWWNNAIQQGQTGVLQDILADDYTVIGPDGKAMTKAQEIALLQSGDLKIDSLSRQDVKVRVYVGAAVVTGRLSLKGTYKDTDLNGDYWYIDLFEYRKDGLKAAWRQFTKVAEEKK